MTTITRMTQQELRQEMEKRFGPYSKHWSFACPACGDVACAQDFIDAGANPDKVGQERIGRLPEADRQAVPSFAQHLADREGA